jgi:hypothetical protein
MRAAEAGVTRKRELEEALNIPHDKLRHTLVMLEEDGTIAPADVNRYNVVLLNKEPYDLWPLERRLIWTPIEHLAKGQYVVYPTPLAPVPDTSLDIGLLTRHPATRKSLFRYGHVRMPDIAAIHEYLENALPLKDGHEHYGKEIELIRERRWNEATFRSLKSRFLQGRRPIVIPRHLILSRELGDLCGLYLAEGSVKTAVTQLSLHNRERYLHDRALNGALLIDPFASGTFYESAGTKKAYSYIFSPIVAAVLRNRFSHGARGKRIPDSVWYWPPEARIGLLGGYFACDGSHCSSESVGFNGTCRTNEITTFGSAKLQLLLQVRKLLLRDGIVTKLTVNNNAEALPATHRQIKSGDSWALTVTGSKAQALCLLLGYEPLPIHLNRRAAQSDIFGDTVLMRVHEVSMSEKAEPVISFELEGGSSFCVVGLATRSRRL